LRRNLAAHLDGAVAHSASEIFRGGSPGGEWHRLSFETQRPASVSHMAATDDDFDDLGFSLTDPRVSFVGVARVGVTGPRA
jgi:hypothetical protein